MYNEIKEALRKYGDIKLSEALDIISSCDLSEIRYDVLKVYGRGCYELSGEYSNDIYTITEFVSEVFEAEFGEPYDDDEELMTVDMVEFISDIIADGGYGDDFGISYQLVCKDKEPSRDHIHNFLKSKKIYSNYDSVSGLEGRFEM